MVVPLAVHCSYAPGFVSYMQALLQLYRFFFTMKAIICIMFLMLMVTMMDSAPVGPVEQYDDDYGKTAEDVDHDYRYNYNFWWE